jgi:hypothetical protein
MTKKRLGMKQYKNAFGVVFTATLLLLASSPVWAEQESAGESADAPAVEEVAEATGLDIVLDGSSLESFEKGLAEIKGTCTSNEYLTLEKSIEFLMFYDVAAKRDKEKLARRLDGMTGRQIIEKVSKRRS